MTVPATVKVDAAPLFADARLGALFDALDVPGETTRINGGAVRDLLMGREVGDVDLSTTLDPQAVIRLAKAAGFKPVPTGIEHGTITVVVQHRPFEVTTLRRDIETDGRHAVVAFGRDFAEDAARRDFTMNGLYLGRDGTVFDFVGGLADLDARHVRFIGDARRRIREDFLRILRFFRFHASHGEGAPDREAMHALIQEREGLRQLSRERIRSEVMKLLRARRAVETVEVMSETGLLGLVLGGIGRLGRLRTLARWESELAIPPDPVLRLAALAVFIEEDVERLREGLRLSRAEAARLLELAAPGPVPAPQDGITTLRAKLYSLKPAAFRDRALLALAEGGPDQTASQESVRALLRLPDEWLLPRLPWTGSDMLARGVPPGWRVGDTLRRLEAAWIAADFPTDIRRLEALSAPIIAAACED